MKEGWLCPRCRKVNAPFTLSCDCQENYYTNNATNCINGFHQWECCGVSTASSTYRCKVCGATKTEDYNMAECKWCKDEFCVNADCPMRADYCPVPDNEGVCRYEERTPKEGGEKNV